MCEGVLVKLHEFIPGRVKIFPKFDEDVRRLMFRGFNFKKTSEGSLIFTAFVTQLKDLESLFGDRIVLGPGVFEMFCGVPSIY